MSIKNFQKFECTYDTVFFGSIVKFHVHILEWKIKRYRDNADMISQSITVPQRRKYKSSRSSQSFAWKLFVHIGRHPILYRCIPHLHSFSHLVTRLDTKHVYIVNSFKVYLLRLQLVLINRAENKIRTSEFLKINYLDKIIEFLTALRLLRNFADPTRTLFDNSSDKLPIQPFDKHIPITPYRHKFAF